MEALRVDAVQVPHRPPEPGLGCADEQMVVVVHETVRVDLEMVCLGNLAAEAQEARSVVLGLQDGPAPPTSIHDVVPGAFELDSQRSGHEATRRRRRADGTRNDDTGRE